MLPRRKSKLYPLALLDIIKTLVTGRALQGPYIKYFEKAFADYHHVKFAISTASGRKGLKYILEALAIEPGSEIILPAYSYHALPAIIEEMGLISVFADISQNNFSIDPDSVRSNITNKTKVIIAAHLFGDACNIQELSDIANSHDLHLIEDCAQSIGSKTEFSRKIGAYGIASFYSFDITKTINTLGGGMVITDDENIYKYILKKTEILDYSFSDLIKKILNYLSEYFLMRRPLNSLTLRLLRTAFFNNIITSCYKRIRGNIASTTKAYTNLQAVLGLKQLQNIDSLLNKRSKSGKEYLSIIRKELDKTTPLPFIRYPLQNSELQTKYLSHSFYNFIILVNSPEEISRLLLKNGIDTGYSTEILSNCDNSGKSPRADFTEEHSFELPMFAGIKKREIKYIISTLFRLLRKTDQNEF